MSLEAPHVAPLHFNSLLPTEVTLLLTLIFTYSFFTVLSPV